VVVLPALAYVVKGSGRSGLDVGVAFAAGKPPVVFIDGPALSLAGELRVDLFVDQAAELAVVDFRPARR
jgi:hypothetical protein